MLGAVIGGVIVAVIYNGLELLGLGPTPRTYGPPWSCSPPSSSTPPPAAAARPPSRRWNASARTMTTSDGSAQAVYDGHPLYTYVGDSAPRQANGNGLNLNGGLWHEVTASG
jgi:hypothetical protein